MRTKKADLVVKIIISVVVVILTGLLVAWMTGLFKDKKQDLNSGTEKIDSAISSMAEFDLLVYDGNTISGDTLTELIEEFKTKDVIVAIRVKTLADSSTDYNYIYTSSNIGDSVTITPPTSKASASYITPKGNFLGEIIKNANNEIVCLQFTQQR